MNSSTSHHLLSCLSRFLLPCCLSTSSAVRAIRTPLMYSPYASSMELASVGPSPSPSASPTLGDEPKAARMAEQKFPSDMIEGALGIPGTVGCPEGEK